MPTDLERLDEEEKLLQEELQLLQELEQLQHTASSPSNGAPTSRDLGTIRTDPTIPLSQRFEALGQPPGRPREIGLGAQLQQTATQVPGLIPVAGGLAGAVLTGSPALGGALGAIVGTGLEAELQGDAPATVVAKGLGEGALQLTFGAFSHGLRGLLRAGLSSTAGGVAFLRNFVGRQVTGAGERVMQPMSREAVQRLRTEVTRTIAELRAPVASLFAFPGKLQKDEQQRFLRFMEAQFPASGRPYRQLAEAVLEGKSLPAKITQVSMDELSVMRDRIGVLIRRLESHVVGQEAALATPDRKTLLQFRHIIDEAIVKGLERSGLPADLMQAARSAQFKLLASDALEQQVQRAFRSKDLLLQFNPDAVVNTVRNAMLEGKGPRGRLIRRAFQDIAASERWQKEIAEMTRLMAPLRFSRATGAFSLRVPILFQTVQRMSKVIADEQRLGVFNAALRRAGQATITGERILPFNVLQLALAAANADELKAAAGQPGLQFFRGLAPIPTIAPVSGGQASQP